MDLDKLEEIFEKKYRDMSSGDVDDSFYIDWCDKHKIIMLHPEWLTDTLNDGGMKGKVCIYSPEADAHPKWLLVPRKFAEKALVLGCLP